MPPPSFRPDRAPDRDRAARAVRRVPARVGLAGNPSDLHGGAVLAVPVPEIVAMVEVAHEPGLSGPIELRGSGISTSWSDLGELRAEFCRAGGGPDGHELIVASLLRSLEHLGHDGGGAWRLTWSTGIPRSVGLAGSSALAIGVIDAVAAVLGSSLVPLVVAALALAVETDDLGITAGWQDRVVQAVGAPVLVETDRLVTLDGVAVPTVHPVVWPEGVELLVGWLPDAAEDSGSHHGRARSASVDGAMQDLARIARGAARSAAAGDVAGLEGAVRATWSTRSASVPLRPDHAALVDAVTAAGFAATTPGSGGSVVAVLPDATARERAVATVEALGAVWAISDPGSATR